MLAAYIYFAAVVVSVTNNSDKSITEIEVIYSVDSIRLAKLIPSQTKEVNIGKIGEGSSFIISWEDGTGVKYKSKFYVYLYDHDLFSRLDISIKNGHATLFYKNENIYIKSAPNK